MAAGLLRQHLARRGIADVRVRSAGFLAEGRPASEFGVEVLRGRGIDLTEHVSAVATYDVIAGADLVLAMARDHAREASLLAPGTRGRVFPLKQLVRRGEALGPRQPDEPVDDWLARVDEGRAARDLVGAREDDDVGDPIGLPRLAYERTADELDGLLSRLVDLVWGAEAEWRMPA